MQRKSGFTLLEIVIVVAIVTLLAGVLIPGVRSHIDSGRAARIVTMVDNMKSACLRFYTDVGRFPVEDSGAPDAMFMDAPHHELSMDQTVAGWDGPYLDHLLSVNDNPSKQSISLSTDIDGTLHLQLMGLSQSVAQLVNDRIDTPEVNWQTDGLVTFVSDRLRIRLLKSQ